MCVADCGAKRTLRPGDEYTITSHNYPRGYTQNTECSWLVETSPDALLTMEFIDTFLIKCEWGTCVHWVEVITEPDASVPGVRFCCSRRPDGVITSSSGRLIVSFKSPGPTSYSYTGFRAVIKAGACDVARKHVTSCHVASHPFDNDSRERERATAVSIEVKRTSRCVIVCH